MAAQAGQLQRQISQAQNSDGGWGYHPGSSWTEPTALAVLALQASGNFDDSYARGCLWLRQRQRPDGGWAPSPALHTSTAVSSWAILALSQTEGAQLHIRHGVDWILRQVNPEPSALQQTICRIFGVTPPKAAGGSPWFPGTAAWIAPTVASILALSEASLLSSPAMRTSISESVRRAQQYILSRKCRDGGWNHGGSPYRSEDAESYPEMTGMALVGLRGVARQELERPLQRAEAYLAAPQCAEALSWLQLGLMSHQRPAAAPDRPIACRTFRDVCLRLLALAGPVPSNKLFCRPVELT
jgi:prenyltransferase beta subunit